jgi:MFS family permease
VRRSEHTVALALCAAEVLAMAGTMTFQALIPTFIAEWRITHTEVGSISGVSYAGYVVAVPVLMVLTDRIDARRIVLLFSVVSGISSLGYALLAEGLWSAALFRGLNGLALAGTYMPGLKALTDRIEGRHRSRYQALYTATFSVGTGLSLLMAGLLAERFGWQAAFAVAGIVPLLACIVLLGLVPAVEPARLPAAASAPLFDLRPVLGNREAMGYVLGYSAHTWELFGFRTWLVAFMTFAAARQAAAPGEATITAMATVILLLGLPASVLGNEAATRFGRRRMLTLFMLLSAGLAAAIGFTAALPFWLTVAVLCLYGTTVMLDSASLTVGTVNAADPARRGATMAVHTTLGSAMAFVSPLASGLALDLSGGGATLGSWAAGFLVLGVGVALGPMALWLLATTDGR